MNVKSSRYRHQEYNQNYVFICKLNIFVSDWFFTGKLQSKYLENYLSRNWNNLTPLHWDALTTAVWIKSSTFAFPLTFWNKKLEKLELNGHIFPVMLFNLPCCRKIQESELRPERSLPCIHTASTPIHSTGACNPSSCLTRMRGEGKKPWEDGQRSP